MGYNTSQIDVIGLLKELFSGVLPILPETLITLDLGVNGLQGPFSNDFCERHTSLQTCILRENRLGGALPEKLGLLINLKQLDLSHNRFIKFLPESCTQLSELRCCDFQGNALEMIHYPQGLEDLSIYNTGSAPTASIPSRCSDRSATKNQSSRP